MPATLIALEGIDGTGKSTQARRLVETLRARGLDAVLLREPTDGPHGREIRRLAREGRPAPERESALFLADRREDVARNIRPALDRGAIVVLDRYYFSTMAYQGARGLDPEVIRRENEAFAPRPDLLILLDMDPVEALRRVREKRGTALDQFEDASYLAAVRSIFNQFEGPWIRRIDGSAGEDAVASAILSHVESLLPPPPIGVMDR